MTPIGRIAILVGLSCAATVAAKEEGMLPIPIEAIGTNGRTFHVSPEKGRPGDGSEQLPFRSLQRGVDHLKPGDTLLLRGGIYENDNPDAIAVATCNGEPKKWIRIANYEDEQPLLKFDSQRALILQGVSYVVVEGLEIDGRSYEIDRDEAFAYAEAFENTGERESKYFGVGIRVEGGENQDYSHHVIVRNNRIHHTSGGGIAAARTDYLLIEGNEVFETSYYSPWGESGISVWESSNHDDAQDVYRTVIRDNVCYRNDNRVKFWIMDFCSDGNGIILDALRTNQDILKDGYSEPYSGRILVANNRCFENGGRGINLYESNSMDLVGNTLLRNSQRENSKYEIEIGRVKDCLIQGNVIVARRDKCTIGGYEYENVEVLDNLLSGRPVDGVGMDDTDYILVPAD